MSKIESSLRGTRDVLDNYCDAKGQLIQKNPIPCLSGALHPILGISGLIIFDSDSILHTDLVLLELGGGELL